MGRTADPLEASAARRPARAEVIDMGRSKEKRHARSERTRRVTPQ
jgi:hypothetical protein